VTTDPSALKLSWSKLRLHDECPAKGPLMRQAKSPYTNIRNYFHGNVVDRLMRHWLDQEAPEPGWMLAHLDEQFTGSIEEAKETGDGVVKWRSRTDEGEVREFCAELVRRLEPLLTEHVLPYPYEPAVRFEAPVTVHGLRGEERQVLLVGEMDLLVKPPDGYEVWDLKATLDNQYYRKVLGQLTFYSWAVRLLHGQFPVRAGLIQPMCDIPRLPVDIDREALVQMASRIEKAARDMWAGNLAPKADNAGCSFCEVHQACPKFRAPRGRGALRRAVA
jgi:hypothetical protein